MVGLRQEGMLIFCIICEDESNVIYMSHVIYMRNNKNVPYLYEKIQTRRTVKKKWNCT